MRFSLLFAATLLSSGVAAADTRSTAPATSTGFLFSRDELGLDRPRIDTTAAVYKTLETSPQIRLQGLEVTVREGRLLVARSSFDTYLTGRVGVSEKRDDRGAPVAIDSRAAVYEWETGLRRRFRNGLSITPSVHVSRTASDASPGNDSRRDELGFAFNVIVPLARGRGRLENEAPELAAGYDLDASLLSLRHVSAQSVASTLAALWQCRAAEERLQLFVRNEAIISRLVDMALALVEAGELGRSLVSEILADQESAAAQRIEGELMLLQARQRLALLMGGNASPSDRPLPADPLPAPPDPLQLASFEELSSIALDRRDDLRASRLLVQSGKVLVEASRLRLRPAIDLRAGFGYTPYRGDGYLIPGRSDRGDDVSGSLALSVEWPVSNSLARGNLIMDRAVYEQGKTQVDDLRRRIESAVFTARAEVRAVAGQVQHSAKSARLQSEALAAQQELFQLGESTLSEVITARQRLIQTELQHLSALERYAIGIIQLRFETGTLLPGDDREGWVTPALWTTPPLSDVP